MTSQEQADRFQTIAIPRVLWWFRLWPFWRTFFEELGCRVVTNRPDRPAAHRHERASTIVEEACFPMQLLIDRTLAISDQADAVFMPRLISVSPRGIMCPRFAGVPDIVRMVLEGGTASQPALCSKVLAPIIDARLGRRSVGKAYLAVAGELGVETAKAVRALGRAREVQEKFEREFERRLNQLPTPDVFDPTIAMDESRDTQGERVSKPRVALLGHPYITLDWEFNLGIMGKLRGLGAWIVPVESVSDGRIESLVKRLDKNVYWSSGREVLGAALSFFEHGGVEGLVYLSCFKCGVDGLLLDVVRWAARRRSKVAYLPLTLDGHDNEVGVVTRLEAFMDMVRSRVV